MFQRYRFEGVHAYTTLGRLGACAGKKHVANGAHPVARDGFQFLQSGQDLQPVAKIISNRLDATLRDGRRACKKCMSTMEKEQCFAPCDSVL